MHWSLRFPTLRWRRVTRIAIYEASIALNNCLTYMVEFNLYAWPKGGMYLPPAWGSILHCTFVLRTRQHQIHRSPLADSMFPSSLLWVWSRKSQPQFLTQLPAHIVLRILHLDLDVGVCFCCAWGRARWDIISDTIALPYTPSSLKPAWQGKKLSFSPSIIYSMKS